MDGCPYDNVSHFPGWSGAQIGFDFAWNVWGFWVEKTLCWQQGDLIFCQMLFQSFLNIYGRLGNTQAAMDGCPMTQWCHIFRADLVLNIGYVTWHFRGVLGRKDTVLTTRGSQISAEAILIILIHLQEVGKHSSSNGWMSLHHSVTFPRLIWCSKLDILLEIWEIVWAKKTLCWP